MSTKNQLILSHNRLVEERKDMIKALNHMAQQINTMNEQLIKLFVIAAIMQNKNVFTQEEFDAEVTRLRQSTQQQAAEEAKANPEGNGDIDQGSVAAGDIQPDDSARVEDTGGHTEPGLLRGAGDTADKSSAEV